MIIQIKDKLRTLLFSEKFAFVHGCIQIITMFAWLLVLSYTNSDYVIYLLVGIAGIFCRIYENQDKNAIFKKSERLNAIIAVIFSLAVTSANYDMISNYIGAIYSSLYTPSQMQTFTDNISNLNGTFYFLYTPLEFIGGVYVAFFILRFFTNRLSGFEWRKYIYTCDSPKIFLSVFLIISVFYSSVMLLCYYPGISSGDSRVQLEQILCGRYSNHHPFYHTMIIRFFVFVGMSVFKSLNVGVALYSIFSILYISASFAYAVVTIYQLHIDKKIVIGTALFCMLLPINIVYSFTMWKDVPFAASVLIFTVSVFRYLENVGKNQTMNFIVSILSGFGVALLRSNGMFVFAIVFVCFAIWFGKKERKMCAALLCVLCLSFIMTNPVLKSIGVEKTELVESLSIPLQQISRTVVDNDDLTVEQRKLITKAMSIEKIKKLYNPKSSDPIKFYLVDYGGQDYISNHMSEYAMLYIKLGITHPKSYITAWIDQTKGYWNGGYNFWKYTFSSSTDKVGTRRIVVSETYQIFIYAYTKAFEYIDFLKPFISIGLYTWLILLTAFIGFRKKNKVTVLLTIPCLANILSLLIATPVFAEFRYAYSLFCCMPFLVVVLFRPDLSNCKSENVNNGD